MRTALIPGEFPSYIGLLPRDVYVKKDMQINVFLFTINFVNRRILCQCKLLNFAADYFQNN
jgi:hypothetical protein